MGVEDGKNIQKFYSNEWKVYRVEALQYTEWRMWGLREDGKGKAKRWWKGVEGLGWG